MATLSWHANVTEGNTVVKNNKVFIFNLKASLFVVTNGWFGEAFFGLFFFPELRIQFRHIYHGLVYYFLHTQPYFIGGKTMFLHNIVFIVFWRNCIIYYVCIHNCIHNLYIHFYILCILRYIVGDCIFVYNS